MRYTKDVKMQKLLTSKELAEYLGSSIENVRRLTRLRRIPAVRLLREYRYDPETVVAALSVPTSEPQPAPARQTRRRRKPAKDYFVDM